jgi:uncharacterized protein (TIGR00255 family)
MTGFGLGSSQVGAGRIVVEIRAVNGRFLDVRVRMPRELADFSVVVETEARKRLSRGRCDIVVRTEGTVTSAPSIDKSRARDAYRSLVALRDEISPGADVPFSMLSAVPDVFTSGHGIKFDVGEKALVAALASGLDDLELMRRKEGRAIADDLARRLEDVRQFIERISLRAPELLEVQARKFRERLSRVRTIVEEGAKAPEGWLDPTRVEQELVILLERSDIAEELTRLTIHADHLLSYLSADGPHGRRLDFLLQEMAREINTIGAKSQDSAIAHAVVELKAEIERMREQVQNVE